MTVELHGYKYSVYAWIARLALHEKGVAYSWQEIDPFSELVPSSYLDLHPFKRVPTLVHANFVLYETGAITRYIDESFAGPRLQREAPAERARCNQILSVVDSYVYWPLVRQVFSHRVMRRRLGRPTSEDEVRIGLAAAPRVLAALENIAAETDYLCGDAVSLADIHLAPMIGYFTTTDEGSSLLRSFDRLDAWWLRMSRRNTFVTTTPLLPPPL